MTQKFCSAIDNLHGACKTEPKEGSKWCIRHNEQRMKLYSGYKAYHASLDAFPEETICRNVNVIRNCSSYDTVKAWSNALRTKYALLQRCIQARACFTERFFGNDMDFGHRTFWHYLNKQKDEVEKLLEHVERKAYELLLASQNAMWVLDQQTDDSSPNCFGHEDEVVTVSAPPPLSADNLQEVEDPVDVALREKRRELQEKMRTRLARYLCPYESSYYMERVRVIWACVSRAIYTDPALMLVAQNYVFVVSMLSDETLDIGMVERMWSAIKDLSVHDVRAAIDDALHPVREKGDYVQVLGTRVHKEMTGSVLPFHGWGHMTALFPCYSCVRRVCTTVDDIVALTRYSLLTASGLAQSYTKYNHGYQGSRELSLCGFIPNTIDRLGPRYTVEKSNRFFDRRNTPLWTEIQTNYIICAGLSLTDPKTQLFVNACLRHPDFMVMCRKGPNGRIIRTKPLCGNRVRKATTRAALKNTPWDPTEDIVFQDSVLEEAWPLLSRDTHLQDCFQIAIMDGGEGEMEDFVQKLVKVWFQVYGVDDIHGLLKAIGNPYTESGELEVEMERLATHTDPIIPNLEFDIQKSYMRLWARTPDDGRLADDEIDIEFVPERQVDFFDSALYSC
ncbi:hypothetical protein CVT24_012514 [Panaeolus cyanescens]|uniref:Uncharacterized protein n=1 Tax=Panaeolus cyanescens TaxID=181874 RepID=A0A409YJZ7_9AGAR|nr:hypothetical protein CVT24_012514 [Panaeolus cyanescens]